MDIDELRAMYKSRGWDYEDLAVMMLHFIEDQCSTGELIQYLDMRALEEQKALGR